MFGLFSKKDPTLAMEELKRALVERLDSIDERLAAASRGERRRQAVLESICDAQNSTIEMLRRERDEKPAFQALFAFAESFALAHADVPETPESGILMRKFESLLASFGIALEMETGIPFDPEKHTACEICSDPSLPEGTVVKIVLPGFLEGDRIVRCATVVVNRTGQEG